MASVGTVFAAIAVLLATACSSGAIPPPPPAPPPPASVTATDGPLAQRLVGAVTVDGAWPHLQALEKIADETMRTVATGPPGRPATTPARTT